MQVGVVTYGYESAWLPASLLEGEKLTQLANALFEASRRRSVGLHINKGLAGSSSEHIATAMNPQARSAFAMALIADERTPNYSGLASASTHHQAARKSRNDVAEAMKALK